jgi:hypothetical protein
VITTNSFPDDPILDPVINAAPVELSNNNPPGFAVKPSGPDKVTVCAPDNFSVFTVPTVADTLTSAVFK